MEKEPEAPERNEIMKKIAVAAADGRVARKVITEAVNRGFDVTAFGRKDENITDAQHYVKKDIFDLTKEDLKGFDAVVDAFGAWTEDTLPQHSTTLAHLCDILSGTETRLLIVGGAGSLYVNPEHTATVSDGPDFPDAFSPWLPQWLQHLLTFVREAMSSGPIFLRQVISRLTAKEAAGISAAAKS